MSKISIRRRKVIQVGGDSFGFTIPKSYITNGIVDLKKRYRLPLRGGRAFLDKESSCVTVSGELLQRSGDTANAKE